MHLYNLNGTKFIIHARIQFSDGDGSACDVRSIRNSKTNRRPENYCSVTENNQKI